MRRLIGVGFQEEEKLIQGFGWIFVELARGGAGKRERPQPSLGVDIACGSQLFFRVIRAHFERYESRVRMQNDDDDSAGFARDSCFDAELSPRFEQRVVV